MATLAEIFQADFDAMTSELPTTITFGAQSGTCSFTELRESKQQQDAFYQEQGDAEATIDPSDFNPAIALNDTVTIASVSYRVSELITCPSGATQRLVLVRSL